MITVTFTEEDRQKAESYFSCDCLLGTALERMGFEPSSVGGTSVRIDHVEYEIPDSFMSHLIEDPGATEKPFYLPSVVGMTIQLEEVRL